MKTVIGLAGAAGVGLMAWIAIGLHAEKRNPDVAAAAAPGIASAPAAPVAVQPQEQTDAEDAAPAVPVSPPADNQAPRWDRQRSKDFNVEATMHARSFQPGMTSGDSPPAFIEMFESSVGGSTITRLFQDQQQLPVDDWSAATEARLRRYFEAQPEISMTSVAVSCRATRCLLQFMELPPTPAERSTGPCQFATQMLLRMKQESWYSEAFIDNDGRLVTPARGEAVQYMVRILNRKKPAVQPVAPE